MVRAARETIPIVGVPLFPFFAVQVGVNGHSFGRFEFVDELMRGFPISLGIPPERLKRDSQADGRGVALDAGLKSCDVHRSKFLVGIVPAES